MKKTNNYKYTLEEVMKMKEEQKAKAISKAKEMISDLFTEIGLEVNIRVPKYDNVMVAFIKDERTNIVTYIVFNTDKLSDYINKYDPYKHSDFNEYCYDYISKVIESEINSYDPEKSFLKDYAVGKTLRLCDLEKSLFDIVREYMDVDLIFNRIASGLDECYMKLYKPELFEGKLLGLI